MLRHGLERGTTAGPKRAPSRCILAWPLRHRSLLADAGCIVLCGFEQGFLDGHGPAQVGLTLLSQERRTV